MTTINYYYYNHRFIPVERNFKYIILDSNASVTSKMAADKQLINVKLPAKWRQFPLRTGLCVQFFSSLSVWQESSLLFFRNTFSQRTWHDARAVSDGESLSLTQIFAKLSLLNEDFPDCAHANIIIYTLPRPLLYIWTQMLSADSSG